MSTKKIQKKSKAKRFLEKVRGRPLTFGELIESIRQCDEITQEELAEKLGVSKAYICDVEKGRRTVSPERASAFAQVLGYSVDSFVARAIEDQLRNLGLDLEVEIRAKAA